MRPHITSDKWFLANGDRLNEHLWAILWSSLSLLKPSRKRLYYIIYIFFIYEISVPFLPTLTVFKTTIVWWTRRPQLLLLFTLFWYQRMLFIRSTKHCEGHVIIFALVLHAQSFILVKRHHYLIQSCIPAIPECLLSSARSFARSKQDEGVDKARSVLYLRARVVLAPISKGAYALHSLSTKRALERAKPSI